MLQTIMDECMKIAYINNRERITGIGRYAFTLYDHLSRIADIDHFFLDIKNKKLELFTNARKDQQIYEASPDYLLDNPISQSLFNNFHLSDYMMSIRLSNQIGTKYDIYHYTNQIIGNAISKSPSKAKKIITVHDLFQDGLFKYTPPEICFSGINSADALICISEYSKNQLLNYNFDVHESDIKTIYQGVDPSFRPYPKFKCDSILKKYSIPNDYLKLLHVGKPFQRKNDIQLVKILQNIKHCKGYSNVVLIKVGQFSQEALQYISKYQLSKDIVNIPTVSEIELISLYNVSDIFVFPSLSEGFGLPILEAMACGIPVVASNTTSIPEIVGDSGILIDPSDTDKFSDSIIDLSNNDNLINYYSNTGLDRASKFSWDRTASKTFDLYREILEE